MTAKKPPVDHQADLAAKDAEIARLTVLLQVVQAQRNEQADAAAHWAAMAQGRAP